MSVIPSGDEDRFRFGGHFSSMVVDAHAVSSPVSISELVRYATSALPSLYINGSNYKLTAARLIDHAEYESRKSNPTMELLVNGIPYEEHFPEKENRAARDRSIETFIKEYGPDKTTMRSVQPSLDQFSKKWVEPMRGYVAINCTQ
jgi:hypothetical protein